jgi:subtilisin family serine protease
MLPDSPRVGVLHRVLVCFARRAAAAPHVARAAFSAILLLACAATTEAQITPGAEFVPGRVIVKLRPASAASAPAGRAPVSIQAEAGATAVQSLHSIGAEVWEVPGRVEDVIARLQDDPRIEYIEPDYVVRAFATPNDPEFSRLWGMTMIQAPQAWDLATGTDVLIGVIDTGVDYAHPDLAANLWVNAAEQSGVAGVDDDGNGYVDDVHGYDFANDDGNPMDDHSHGTHVAGTIAAVGNNGVSVVGVNWTARIMALKFIGSSGFGATSHAIRAVEYATRMGARLTNNSWGGAGFSQALYDAIRAARDAGRLFVASAGNDGTSQASYPALYDLDNVVSVAATDTNDVLANFSQYNSESVDLGAPGTGVVSTVPGTGTGAKNGTSMASPHVAGVAALVWSAHPALSFEDVKGIVLGSVDANASLAGKTVTGGRLNAFQALTLAQTWTPLGAPALTLSPASFTVTLDPDAQATRTLSIANAAGVRTLYWAIDVPACAWLTPSARSGKAAAGATSTVDLTLNAFALEPGDYSCTLTLTTNDAANDTVLVTVNLHVNTLPPAAAALVPAALAFALDTGQGGEATLVVHNTAAAGSRNLHWSATREGLNVDWLSIDVAGGVIAPQDSATIRVGALALGLSAGAYPASLAVTTNDPGHPLVTVPVELTVVEPAVGGRKFYAFFSGSPGGFRRSDLDGANVATTFTSPTPLDGAIDEIGRKLYWITFDDLFRSDLDGTNQETLLTGLSTPYSMAIDPVHQHVYWIEVFPVADRRIRRANFDGTQVVTLVSLVGQNNNGLSLDVPAGKMYWLEGFPNSGVWRADLDGGNVEKIVNPPSGPFGQGDPFGLAIDPLRGKLYWGETYPSETLHRCNLDGTGDEAFVPGVEVRDLAIDVHGGMLYWGASPIERIGLDGTGRQSLGRPGNRIALDLFDPPAAAADAYAMVLGGTLARVAADPDDLLDDDDLGTPAAVLASFGGGALGGDVTANAAGASVACAGGTLTVNADGGFTLAAPTAAGPVTFEYRIENAFGVSDATVTIEVRQAPVAQADQYETPVNVTLTRAAADPDDLLDNDTRGVPAGAIASFGAGSLGGAVADHAPGSSVALGGGTLTVRADGSFELAAPTTPGTYTFLYRLANDAGASDGAVSIEVVRPLTYPAALERRVAAGADDAEEDEGGSVSLSSSDLEMVVDDGDRQTVGVRFRGLTLPANARITGAWIQFAAEEPQSRPASLLIQGQASLDAAAFTTSRRNLSARIRTRASVAWPLSATPWAVGQAGTGQRTPDLAAIVQELVDQPGWASGNAMAFLVTGTGVRTAWSYDGRRALAPLLHVDYETLNLPPVVNAGPGQTIGLPPGVARLQGAATDDGVPAPAALSFTWSQVDGPDAALIATPNAAVTDVTFPAAGVYVLQLEASDGALAARDTLTVNVRPATAVPAVVERRVATGRDDAEEEASGAVDLSSSDLELVDDDGPQTVGLRFAGLAIPRGARITSAWVQFQADEAQSVGTNLVIHGQASDHAATFATTTRNLSSRPRTTESVAWSPAAWSVVGATGAGQRTPDLANVIQAIVDRGGWTSGNALALLITGAGHRTAESYEGRAAGAPLLHVEFTTLAAASKPAPDAAAAEAESMGPTTARVVPNPMRGAGVIELALGRAGAARIDLFDVQGRRASTPLDASRLEAGVHRVTIGPALRPGLYFYRVQAPDRTLRGRVLVVE